MTQSELAARLGVNASSLGCWEIGLYLPRETKTLIGILEWLAEDIPTNCISIFDIDGSRIRNERLRRGMSQRELAGRLGVGMTSIRKWEHGTYPPRHSHLKVLKEWLEEDNIDSPGPSYPLTELLAPDFGDRIVDRRREWGITQSELAERLGVHEATLSGWENGRYFPSAVKAHRLWEWLAKDIPVGWVSFGRKDGDRIRNERLRRSMTQRDLAGRLGVEETTIRNWERGTRIPLNLHLKLLREWFEDEKVESPETSFPLTERPSSNYGDRIAERRRELGMTQGELAERLGIGLGTLKKWERCIRLPRSTKAQKLREWLVVEDILSGTVRSEEIDGNRIRAERLRLRMTPRELGDFLGVGETTIRDWERGTRTPLHSYHKLIREWLEGEKTEPPAMSSPLTKRPSSNFGDRIAERRRELGMTQIELAERLGVKGITMSRLERGIRRPSSTMTQKLREWLDEDIPSRSVRLDEIDGNRIRTERLRLRMTQRELGDSLGVSEKCICSWERGRSTPRNSYLKRLGDWLEESVDLKVID